MKAEKAQEIGDLAKNMDVYEPVAYVLLVSNGINFQGGGQIENLEPVDRVDLVCYLIRQLGITVDDLEDKDQLSDEITLMQSICCAELRRPTE